MDYWWQLILHLTFDLYIQLHSDLFKLICCANSTCCYACMCVAESYVGLLFLFSFELLTFVDCGIWVWAESGSCCCKKSLYAKEILTTRIYNIGLACFLVNSDVDLRLVRQFQCPIFQTLVTCVFWRSRNATLKVVKTYVMYAKC